MHSRMTPEQINEGHKLVNALHNMAESLDPVVYESAADSGCTDVRPHQDGGLAFMAGQWHSLPPTTRDEQVSDAQLAWDLVQMAGRVNAVLP